MAERPLPAPSNTTVWVPETLLERTARAVELKQPVIAAFQASEQLFSGSRSLVLHLTTDCHGSLQEQGMPLMAPRAETGGRVSAPAPPPATVPQTPPPPHVARRLSLLRCSPSPEDADELRRCLLKESQFLISCTLHDFERPSPSTPLPQQFLQPGARSKLVRGLQADLARVNQQLQQEEQRQPGPAPASPAAEGRES